MGISLAYLFELKHKFLFMKHHGLIIFSSDKMAICAEYVLLWVKFVPINTLFGKNQKNAFLFG